MLVRRLGYAVGSKNHKTAFRNNLFKPSGNSVLGFCDGARPEGEGVAFNVLLSRFQKALPRDSLRLPVSFPASHL